MLRETARRLWGKNPSPEAFSLWQCLEETAEGVGVAEEEGRAVCRRFVRKRGMTIPISNVLSFLIS